MKTTDELKILIDELNKLSTEPPVSLGQLKFAAEEAGKSWSGSWIGYQSRIYYDSFSPVPAGAHFSIEWGGMDTFANDTNGDWKEYDYDYVIEYTQQLAELKNIAKEEKECENIKKELSNSKVKAKSILGIFIKKSNDDFVKEQLQKLQKIKIHSASDFIKVLRPRNVWTRDSLAMSQGLKVPPHFDVIANVTSLETHYTVLKDFINTLEQIKTHINRIEDNIEFTEEESCNARALKTIGILSNRLHNVARQLRQRYNNRETLDVKDEYDVQDLFHSLLSLFFDDIRPEEWTPSYAGGSSRMDFLLEDERIVIEIKMTRKGLANKEASEQLIIDKEKYKAHPKCKYLICFVYDPEGRIKNPRGFEKDLSSQDGNIPVIVYVRP